MPQEQTPKEVQGPPMICATKILRPGGARIGKIAGNLTLPRTIPLNTAVASGIGIVVMLAFAAVFLSGLQAYMYAAVVGGAAGYVITTYSPLKGESLLRWAGLTLKNTGRMKYQGVPVVVAVGTAKAGRSSQTKVVIRRSSIPVSPGAVDQRGAQL